jgi:sulfate adenylyltransferase (ADP) / ATP adenylyltransferase
LRYCPSLAKKPTPSKQDGERSAKKVDPFENPSRDLLIAEIPASAPSHVLVLNKFPVIEDHFIIATKAYKEQTHRLEQEDIALAFECLKSWESGGQSDNGRKLFAFFNSGPHSGASQRHRHLQFLPVESMLSQTSDGNGWEALIDILAGSWHKEDSSKTAVS